MLFSEIKKILQAEKNLQNKPLTFELQGKSISFYPNSVFENGSVTFFIGKENSGKYLYLLKESHSDDITNLFIGTEIEDTGFYFKRCDLNLENRIELQKVFKFTKPSLLGVTNSMGMGDRLGLANAGHIRAITGSGFKPILAQQSIRELTRTNRSAHEVMNAAVWAVFQEGYTDGFGSDGDHLKTPEDIERFFYAGYTMFTFDPGEHVNNNADKLSEDELLKVVADLPWVDLKDTFPAAERRYTKNEIKISDDFSLKVETSDFLKAYAKYGKAILHIKKLYDHLNKIAEERPFEVEVSVDETESVTSPFEHFFFANELKRLEVKFVSLAPRFVGSFEKGIDYKGDLDLFKTEYEKHLAITKHFGNYKISLHSGSDKFSVYKVIGSMKKAHTHVKTAGTSYLEALKTVAYKNPAVFKSILDFASSLYETEKLSYHVSADIKRLKKGAEYKDEELPSLFDSTDARQVLHVTFGRTLSEKDSNGNFLFKDDILNCLKQNEELHYELLINHFNKHIEPFK